MKSLRKAGISVTLGELWARPDGDLGELFIVEADVVAAVENHHGKRGVVLSLDDGTLGAEGVRWTRSCRPFTRVDGSGICVRGSAQFLGQTLVQTANGLSTGHAFVDTLPTPTKAP